MDVPICKNNLHTFFLVTFVPFFFKEHTYYVGFLWMIFDIPKEPLGTNLMIQAKNYQKKKKSIASKTTFCDMISRTILLLVYLLGSVNTMFFCNKHKMQYCTDAKIETSNDSSSCFYTTPQHPCTFFRSKLLSLHLQRFFLK